MKHPLKMLSRVRHYLAYRRSLGYVLREEGRLVSSDRQTFCLADFLWPG